MAHTDVLYEENEIIEQFLFAVKTKVFIKIFSSLSELYLANTVQKMSLLRNIEILKLYNERSVKYSYI